MVSGLGSGTLSKTAVYVICVDSFQLEIVVGRTLSVDVNRHLSPAKRRGVKEFRVSPGGKGESVKKLRVESRSVLAVSALIVSPVAAEVTFTGVTTSFTVTVSVTCPITKAAFTLVVSVT